MDTKDPSSGAPCTVPYAVILGDGEILG